MNSEAQAKGFTKHATVEDGAYVLELLVKPDTDFDSRFIAWDTEIEEWIWVSGWMIETLTIGPAD